MNKNNKNGYTFAISQQHDFRQDASVFSFMTKYFGFYNNTFIYFMCIPLIQALI